MLSPSLPPGFRFHPTDGELILHYLRNRAASRPCPVSIIAEVDIYKFDPWELPAKAMYGDREWYFFTPRDRKYPNGVRPNRAARSGYWKATGTDKVVLSGNENIGVKKALVFYKGRPPKGQKTNWIMHEYRLAETKDSSRRPMRLRDSSMRLDDWVLCRIYKKSHHLHSMALVMDQEKEDSSMEEFYLPTTITQEKDDSFKMPKSSSLSKLFDDSDYSVLSQLLDNPSNFLLGPERDSLVAQTNLNKQYNNNCDNGGNLSIQSVPRAPNFPVLIAENSFKRSRPINDHSEEANNLLKAQKKHGSHMPTNLNGQLDSPQYNLNNLPFLSQQLLLNSHLNLQ